MRNNPLSELVPVEREGWLSLQGHRRYHYPASANSGVWITTFLTGAGIQVLSGDARMLEMTAMRFNNFFIAHQRTPALSVRWARRIAHFQSRYLFLFVRQGSVVVEGDASRWARSDSGLCIVFPGEAPVDMICADGTELILFTFDRSEVAPDVLTLSNMGDMRVSTNILRSAYAYLSALVDAPPVSGEPTEVLRSLTREVARALTRTSIGEVPSDAGFHQAQRVIDARSMDPDFDIESLAAQCAVSPRTLGRIFARQGLTPAHEIRRSRAQRALPLLMESPRLTLDEIAAASGFRSISTMNRALLASYGMSASAARYKRSGSSPMGVASGAAT